MVKFFIFFLFHFFNFGVLLLLCLVLLLLSGFVPCSFYSSVFFLILVALTFFSFILSFLIFIIIIILKLIIRLNLLSKKLRILMSSGLPLLGLRSAPGPKCPYCRHPVRLCICRRCLGCLQVYW